MFILQTSVYTTFIFTYFADKFISLVEPEMHFFFIFSLREETQM